jgi:transglutaminase-like putative cysteine protease
MGNVGSKLHVQVGCALDYHVPAPTPMVLMLQPHYTVREQLLDESSQITPAVPVEHYLDQFGNRVWRLVAPAGSFQIQYTAQVVVDATPDLVLSSLEQTPVAYLPTDVLPYTLPSRYCDSDLLLDEAWRLFGSAPAGWGRVQAICDWVHTEITYGVGSTSHTTASEAYGQRRGVCRDFAHIAMGFCRALNIPARYVSGYLPDIGVPPDPTPMDFHAWFEAYLDGAWYTFDARHNRPRTGRVVIGRGRDAVDVAFATSYGPIELTHMRVWADQVQEPLAVESNSNLSFSMN